ncbi:hypothetical protein JF66_17085 [Cryobacterium sp. MLB-32]|uniref:hypothetical protein n=1 Tax=Cryobacterium sp. MLB-32 TaxID=1529318 RepID=UPI0004E767A8|nr:hypothetical protein [Cryobacterium sp. MLB-32]KFF58636.1 hypothetical protein JF66_17085 [Cryobacterium sp. MLB-32]
MTAADTDPLYPGAGAGGHLLLEQVAAGDEGAFGALYDAFVAETYAICLYNLAKADTVEGSMARTWTFIWSNAASLNDQAGSTKTIVLSTAWAFTSERRRRPHRLPVWLRGGRSSL